MPKHQRPVKIVPDWVKQETNPCLVSVAEETYTARRLAVEDYGAERFDSCQQILASAAKSLRIMEDQKASVRKRCDAGERAYRKFWEAKVCARREGGLP